MVIRNLLVVTAVIALSACSTVTMLPQGNVKLSSQPTYQQSHPFFLWGLVGESRVNVLAVCNNQDPIQLQTQETFLDGFLGVVTLGVYFPRTAKVWCPKESNNEI
jgi:hypothetical protein